MAMCVWTLLADAARENWTVHQLKERMNSEHPLCAAIAEAFEKDGPMLRSELETIGWDYPELVDVEWSVRNVVEVVSTCQTELLSRVSEPFVSFKLHVLPAGETKTRPIEFHCDINQFQDLHSKFKEAMNVVEQLKKD
ncbi:unnamed protein product [Heligmosomoides polygyrus]|uniref:COMM domain-containing protein n=1 Tax=Heligmosomoides polygyrus TaxID=6339 RepID=A0A3P7UQ58_HELPZ|nr:unnamed protein product [Heligmosomoides polygyrus]